MSVCTPPAPAPSPRRLQARAAGLPAPPAFPDALADALNEIKLGQPPLRAWQLATSATPAGCPFLDRGQPSARHQVIAFLWQKLPVAPPAVHVLVRSLLGDALGGVPGRHAAILADAWRAAPEALLAPGEQPIWEALAAGEAALAACCRQQRLPPRVLLGTVGLAGTLPVARSAFTQLLSETLAHPGSEREPGWVFADLRLLERGEQVRVAEIALDVLDPDDARPMGSLDPWLKSTFGPAAPRTRWAELSAGAQERLLKRIGGTTYLDFEMLVEIVCARVQATLSERGAAWQKNQLRMRSAFWHNYRERMARMRILLPGETHRAVTAGGAYRFGRESARLETLAPDCFEATEVCIFDLGRCYVVEVFRGRKSETRLFHPTPENERVLFAGSGLTLAHLRAMEGAEVLDHAYAWQPLSERALARWGVFPGEGLTHFRKNHDGKGEAYDRNRGLPVSADVLAERQKQLPEWEMELRRHQARARQWLVSRR